MPTRWLPRQIGIPYTACVINSRRIAVALLARELGLMPVCHDINKDFIFDKQIIAQAIVAGAMPDAARIPGQQSSSDRVMYAPDVGAGGK